MAKGCIKPKNEDGSLRDISSETATMQLLEEAQHIFNQCYAQYSELYSANHLEAIKCITMMGLVFRRLNRLQDALEWCRKEVKVREEVQGELHPRTQQARRVYTELVERIRLAAKAKSNAGSAASAKPAGGGGAAEVGKDKEGGGGGSVELKGEAASKGHASTVKSESAPNGSS